MYMYSNLLGGMQVSAVVCIMVRGRLIYLTVFSNSSKKITE